MCLLVQLALIVASWHLSGVVFSAVYQLPVNGAALTGRVLSLTPFE